MGLFTRRPLQLPTTSYGYSPPPEATARGWLCNNEGCGAGNQPAPRSWPFRCPQCGGLADPDFSEPWAEEARGPRLQMLLDREIRDGRGGNNVFEAGIWEWRYGRALAAGENMRAEEIRVQMTAWLANAERKDQFFYSSSARFMLIVHALDYGQTGAAAAELQGWYAASDTSDVANNSRNRTNCLTLLNCQLRFLEDARTARHPAALQVATDARTLGAAVQRELPLDLQQRWARLH